MTPEPRPWKKYILTGGALYVVWWPYPPDYSAELANKTRAMVIAIDNPDPNLEIKIDQRRPVVRTKQATHTLLFLLLFGSPVWPVRQRVNELKFKRHGLVQ